MPNSIMLVHALSFLLALFLIKADYFFLMASYDSLLYYIGNLAGVQCSIRGSYPKSGLTNKKVKIFRAFSLVNSVAEKILTSYT
jgi:hypothetical protein